MFCSGRQFMTVTVFSVAPSVAWNDVSAPDNQRAAVESGKPAWFAVVLGSADALGSSRGGKVGGSPPTLTRELTWPPAAALSHYKNH